MDLTNRFNAMTYCGVGIVTEYAGPDTGFRIGVLSSFNETPAQRAGLRTNDRLLRIETPAGWRIPIDNDEVYNHMRGPQGSRTRIEVLRTGSTTPEIISLTRDMIITRGRNAWEGAVPYIILDSDNRCQQQLGALPPRHGMVRG